MDLKSSVFLLSLLTISITQPAAAAPRLRLSTTAVGPVAVAQGANASTPTVDATNIGDGTLNLRVAGSASWLAPSIGAPRACPITVFTSGTCVPIQIALQTSSLARGTYTGIVTVADPNAIDAPQTITVTVIVGSAVPDRFDFFVRPGGAAEMRFATANPLNTVVTNQQGGNWLAISLEGSGSFRFNYPYRVSATHQPGMAEGLYNAAFVTSGSPLAAENKTVQASMRVTSQPIAQLSTESLRFRIAQNSARQTQTVAVTNRGLGTLSLSGATAAAAAGGTWVSAERVEGRNAVSVAANPAGLNPGTYQGTVTLAGNMANPVAIPVTLDVVAAGTPVAYARAVVNNATFESGDEVSQGDIVAVFGEQFTTGDPVSASSLPLGAEMAGTRVFVNDQPAPVYFVSYAQINFQIPFDARLGDGVVRVDREGQRGNSVFVGIVRSAPRLLRLGIGNYGIIVNQDGTFPMPITTGIPSRPARIGETLVIYAIGLGPTSPVVASGAASPSSPLAGIPNTRVILGSGVFGESAEVRPLFAGLTPGFVGLYQINVQIPEDAPRGSTVPLIVTVDDVRSNPVAIAIQ